MLKDALSRLQWAGFLKQDDIMSKYKEQLQILLQMKNRVAHKSCAASISSLHQFQDTAGELIGAFDHFIEARRAESETFQFL